MSKGQHQPDFALTIGGTDVTNYTEEWELIEVDDGVSTLTVTIVNHDGKFGGKFKGEDKVELRWGIGGSMGPKVTLIARDISENYTVRGLHVIVTAYDGSAKLSGASGRGKFDTNSAIQSLKACAEMGDMNVVGLDKCKDPLTPEGKNQELCNERLTAAMRRLAQQVHVPARVKMGGKGNPKKPIKALPQPKSAKFTGRVTNGTLAARSGGMAKAAEENDMNSFAKNFGSQVTDSGASTTIRGTALLIGVPNTKAKKGITINNVGGHFSGKWYVRGVSHTWSVGRGYHTRCELLRSSLGEDGEKGDQPIIQSANIYSSGGKEMYVGPREIDAGSQATYTFGQNEHLLVDFKGTISTQAGVEAGEGADMQKTLVDDPESVEGDDGGEE
jgi:hypothetical protein